MKTEQSRAVALAFVEHFSAGRAEQALGLLADDVQWWVAGHADQFPLAGSYRKTELPDLFQWIGTALPHGVSVSVLGVTAEHSRVALEVEANGVTAHGEHYRNRIHFLFEVSDGKIIEVREYLDTQHAFQKLVAPA